MGRSFVVVTRGARCLLLVCKLRCLDRNFASEAYMSKDGMISVLYAILTLPLWCWPDPAVGDNCCVDNVGVQNLQLFLS
jgi:hypothetical protein